MKRSNYWYIRVLMGRETRALFVGLGTGAALLLIFLIWVAVSGWLGGDVHFSVARVLFEVLFVAIASYCVGVTAYTLKMTPRDVHALGPALALDAQVLAREAATITEQSNAIHIWTVFWSLTAIVITWWVSRMVIEDNTLAGDLSQTALAGWPYFRNLIYAFALSQLAWIDISLARRLGRLMEEHGRVNLLDRSDLRPLAQRTRRSVLMWIPLISHSGLFIVVLIAVVTLPATGIRRRYVETKQEQLEKVRARIAERSTSVVDGVSTPESSSLPELVAWEQRLQQAKVWPYDMTMYLRVFLYAGIGLSSWVGAALVEQFIGAFIR